ncbi:MAG: molybdopterin-binding protein [Eubacteriales bacterium]|nr:molybdopterin-binding protein [Eubacteriales bacterium]
MKKIPIEEAIGESLCHDMTAILAGGFKGVRFPRGHVIQAEDLEILRDMGKNHVFVWDPEQDEIHEEDAAIALLKGLKLADTFEVKGPSEGKISLHAKQDGLFIANPTAMREINQIEDWSITSIAAKCPVRNGDLLAAWRIIPLVTQRKNIEAALEIAGKQTLFELKPFKPKRVVILITGNEVYSGRIKDAFAPILTKKLADFPSEIIAIHLLPDDLDRLSSHVEDALSSDLDLVLLTGGMSVDPDDLTPSIIRRYSDQVICRGVPMQPGNMLTVAQAGKTVLMGVPAASMHARYTSLDVFLARFFADDLPDPEEIAEMGIGGLYSPNAREPWPVLSPKELEQ